MTTRLTNEEKQIVLRLINQKTGMLSTFLGFSPYIIPSIAMAIYGLIKQDFLATLVAYGILLFMVILYLVYTEKDAKNLRSALKKYESEFDS